MKKVVNIILLLSFCLTSCKKQKVRDEETKDVSKDSIVRKKSTISNAAFPIKDLLGIWTVDPNGPHADFELTKEYFFLVDYDGDGEMPYKIEGNDLEIYYSNSQQSGLIKKAQNDSLIIYWASGEYSIYTRWKK